MANDVFNTLYNLTLALIVGSETYEISPSDVISIAMIHRYDTATYPIVRIRLYADLTVVQNINEDPDNIQIRGNLDGGVYRINAEDKSSTIIGSTQSISLQMKGYLENKNIPTSKIDQYQFGIKTPDDLNANSKVAFEIFCYDDKLIHQMKQKTQSVYRDMSLETVINDIFRRCNITELSVDPIQNQKRYNQILIPNLSAIEAFSYFDRYYGLYPHGGMLYGDLDKMYLCDSVAQNSSETVPIYIQSDKSDSDEGGMMETTNGYKMKTHAVNVSVLTETDIERVLNPEIISDINVNTLSAQHTNLTRLYDTTDIDSLSDRIEQKNILHKTDRTTISVQEAARLNEQITRVDLSGAGFDIALFHPNTRINLVFESPIRGLNMADAYRAKYVCHVLENASGNLFSATTTMQLCTN